MSAFEAGLALLLAFMGLWIFASQALLPRKIFGWVLVQSGLGFLLLSLGSKANPLPAALLLDLFFLTLAISLFLLILARHLRREKRTLDSRTLSRLESLP
ncbi:MAG TPA: NADH-quinone oxidoreductase subunit K [bacterium]|nr:NADH-quinone oxidoreductase subunit K [bacterium]